MSRTSAVDGRLVAAAYGAAAVVTTVALLLSGWYTVDRTLLAGLLVAASAGTILLAADRDTRPWRAQLLTASATMLIGGALLAAGGGAAAATFSVCFVWVVIHSVANLSMAWAWVQIGLVACVQAAYPIAVGDGDQAPLRVAVTLAVAVSAGRGVRVALQRARSAAGLDDLTGLPNRSSMHRALGTALAQGRRSGRGVSVVVLDLDDLKAINDTLGHAAGDQALTDAGRSWSRQLRTGDVLGRVGGDEFVAVLTDTDEATAREIVQRLDAATPSHLSASIGAATARPDVNGAVLLAAADAAMYEQKRRRRGDRTELARAPTVDSTSRRGHDVCFFRDDAALLVRLVDYVSDGLDVDDVCLLVAHPSIATPCAGRSTRH